MNGMTKLAQKQHLIDLLRYDRVIKIRCDQADIDEWWANHDKSQDAGWDTDREYYEEQADEIFDRIYDDTHMALQQHDLSLADIDEWFELIVANQVPQIVYDDRILIEVEYY